MDWGHQLACALWRHAERLEARELDAGLATVSDEVADVAQLLRCCAMAVDPEMRPRLKADQRMLVRPVVVEMVRALLSFLAFLAESKANTAD